MRKWLSPFLFLALSGHGQSKIVELVRTAETPLQDLSIPAFSIWSRNLMASLFWVRPSVESDVKDPFFFWKGAKFSFCTWREGAGRLLKVLFLMKGRPVFGFFPISSTFQVFPYVFVPLFLFTGSYWEVFSIGPASDPLSFCCCLAQDQVLRPSVLS